MEAEEMHLRDVSSFRIAVKVRWDEVISGAHSAEGKGRPIVDSYQEFCCVGGALSDVQGQR